MAKPRKDGRAKGKRKKTNLKEAVVLIPLAYNDGTKVSWETIEAILEEIYLAFQGWTNEGTIKGAYRMQGGQKCVEDLLKVAVIIKESQIRELEAMVARWGATLGQETMLLKIANHIVKFIPPQGWGKKKP